MGIVRDKKKRKKRKEKREIGNDGVEMQSYYTSGEAATFVSKDNLPLEPTLSQLHFAAFPL